MPSAALLQTNGFESLLLIFFEIVDIQAPKAIKTISSFIGPFHLRTQAAQVLDEMRVRAANRRGVADF